MTARLCKPHDGWRQWNLRVSPEVHERLRYLSYRRNTSINVMVNAAISDWLSKQDDEVIISSKHL